MADEASYREYVSDETFSENYRSYQSRYRRQMRESDRVFVDHIKRISSERPAAEPALQLLDVGCSTGNLLYHLKQHVPNAALLGGELMTGSVEQCLSDPELAGIQFERIDMLEIPYRERFDVITSNAVSCLFEPAEFERAIASIAKALRPSGHLIAFEWFHPFNQELKIFERSKSHPQGMFLHFRPYSFVQDVLQRQGFEAVRFEPFAIPIDLDSESEETLREELSSYTVVTRSGERLIFRGALATPWCHLVARRARS